MTVDVCTVFDFHVPISVFTYLPYYIFHPLNEFYLDNYTAGLRDCKLLPFSLTYVFQMDDCECLNCFIVL